MPAAWLRVLAARTCQREARARTGRRGRRARQLDHAATGDTLTAGKQAHPPLAKVVPHAPVLAIAVAAKERKDDVKLGQASGAGC